MMNNLHQAGLLVVDVQIGIDDLYDMPRNNPQAEDNIATLIATWRAADREIIHVKHNSTSPSSPLRPESSGNRFKPEAVPLETEKVFEKTVNSAFIGTNLEAYLRNKNLHKLLIVGFTTDHCISTTTRMAGNLGFDVGLVCDATATFARTGADGQSFTANEVHNIHLLSLDGEFCQLMTTNECF